MQELKMQNRYKYIDYLKFIAIIAVVVIHVLGDRYYYTFDQNMSWYILLFFASLVRFAVPIFIMCSGALMLNENKNITIKKTIYNVIKYILIFILWSLIYAITDFLLFCQDGTFWNFIKDKMINFKYHLWFLPVLISCYLVTPFLRCALKIENKKVVEYILLIFLVVITINSFTENIKKNILPVEFLSYILIYITGWYLSSFDFSSKVNKLMITIGIIAYFLSPIANILLSFIFKNKVFWTSNNFNILNYLSSVGIFLLFKTKETRLHESKIIKSVSSKTLYIYLIHVLIIEIIQKYLLNEQILKTYQGAFIFITLIPIVFIISYVIGCVLEFLFKRKNTYHS